MPLLCVLAVSNRPAAWMRPESSIRLGGQTAIVTSSTRAITADASPPSPQARRVVLSSLLGTTIEYYEFFIYGIAASLVFGELFFPSFDPFVGTLLSLATFGVGFVARPIGGFIFGHFGDRLGRKRMLVISLLMMGTSTFAIGLLPSYAAIGIWAPLLLILARTIQGISLGGEYSGAVLMSVEHAGEKRRGLFGSIVGTGSGWGLLLANLVFLVVSQLDDQDFMAWGWRIPFLLSAILVILALAIRIRLEESPDFAKVQEAEQVHRFPLTVLAREHWAKVLLIAVAMISAGIVFYVSTVFSLTYGQRELNVSRFLMLTLVLGANVIVIVGMPSFGWLSDRIGRRPIFITSAGRPDSGPRPMVSFAEYRATSTDGSRFSDPVHSVRRQFRGHARILRGDVPSRDPIRRSRRE